jgi:hypothetical protein
MKSASDILASSKEHADWIPLLELSVREVFELMLGCHLKPLEAIPEQGLDITSMVGLAGQLCGILSVRSSKRLGCINDFQDARCRRQKGQPGSKGRIRRNLQHGSRQFQEQDFRLGRRLPAIRSHGDHRQ